MAFPSQKPVSSQLTREDERKRFIIELVTGKSLEHWARTNAKVKALVSAQAAK